MSVDARAAIFSTDLPTLRAAPGQFFLAVPQGYDPYLPRAVFPFEVRDGLVRSFVQPTSLDYAYFLRGPYGRAFELPPKGRRALVLAANEFSLASLVGLVEALVARECELTLIFGGAEFDPRWLPPEVEIRVSDDVLAAATPLFDWADAVYASAPNAFYDEFYRAARAARVHLERGWAQVLVHDLAMPCGVGWCYGCAFKLARVVLNCQDGPTFDLAAWVPE
jgi:hypothetical protein